eukprot:Opistho-1_new@11030
MTQGVVRRHAASLSDTHQSATLGRLRGAHPTLDLPSDPRAVVERQVMARGRMLGDRQRPRLRQPARALRIDQRIACAREHQQGHRRAGRRRSKACGGEQLPQRIGARHRTLAPPRRPRAQQRVAFRRAEPTPAGQRQDAALPFGGAGVAQRQPQQRRVPRRTQPLVKGAEGPQAGVDQHGSGQLARLRLRPGHRHHRAERHRQHAVGRRHAQGLQRGAAVRRHRRHAGRAALRMQRTVARQVERDDRRAGLHRAQLRSEVAPVPRLARQSAQQHPRQGVIKTHRRSPRYQRASACSWCCSRAAPCGSQAAWPQAARAMKSSQATCRRSTRCWRCWINGLNRPWRVNNWRGFFLTHSHEPISSVSGRNTRSGCCSPARR